MSPVTRVGAAVPVGPPTPGAARRRGRLSIVDDGAEIGGAQLSLINSLPGLAVLDPELLLLKDGPEAARLRRAGHPVRAGLLGGRFSMSTKDRLLPSPRAVLAAVRAVGTLRAACAEGVVYANTLQSASLAAIACRLTTRGRVVWHVRDAYTPEHLPSGALRTLVRTLIRQPRVRVVANSRYTAGVLPCASTVVYSTLAREFFAPVRPVDDEMEPVVVMVGRLDPWKGQDVLLAALDTPDLATVRVDVAGSASPAHRPYEQELRRRAAALPGGRVRFLGHVEDVRSLIDGAAVVVHATRTPEPFGQVVLQGMARGRVVVATAGGGVDELVEDGRTGLVYPAGDVGALRALLRRVLRDRELRARLGTAARRAAEAFEPVTRGDELVALLDRELDAAGSPR